METKEVLKFEIIMNALVSDLFEYLYVMGLGQL